jgi:hypothetical protein
MQVFSRRLRGSNHALIRPTAEKREGTKSRREVVRRQSRGVWVFNRGARVMTFGRYGADCSGLTPRPGIHRSVLWSGGRKRRCAFGQPLLIGGCRFILRA